MSSPSPARVVTTSFRVRYAETDAMGIVHHAAYMVWFEAGRGANLCFKLATAMLN